MQLVKNCAARHTDLVAELEVELQLPDDVGSKMDTKGCEVMCVFEGHFEHLRGYTLDLQGTTLVMDRMVDVHMESSTGSFD